MAYDIKDAGLVKEGIRRTEWADADMPVLKLIRKRLAREQSLKGVRMSCCLHVTAETANLVRTLKAGGADVVLCASNPLSTQDDIAAALSLKYGIPTFAIHGEDHDTYYKHIDAALAHEPNVTMDDGADLVSAVLTKRKDLAGKIIASMEETTTGVIRLRAMEKDGMIKFPVFAVNDADCKHLFDNRYGTGQSTIDGVMRATDLLLAGKKVVVCGYGMCGRGVATRARGMGAHVIVTEVDPLRALEATMDGFWVMSMKEAAPIGELFVTLTGNADVIRKEHFAAMKDGAMVANSGHFNVEIKIPDLEAMSKQVRRGVRENVDEFVLKNGNRIRLLGEGRLINLAAAEGHPASVMDMSFAVQALTTEFAVKNKAKLSASVHKVPREIDEQVASLKLKSMGISIDALTERQKKYLTSWDEGT
ncbi:MAG TPA: adenosylhomocysteinase [Candidatus Brocadiia bacterium]|nr:adenosylhomocysteinase [Candidatus Brocadiia bacterium]